MPGDAQHLIPAKRMSNILQGSWHKESEALLSRDVWGTDLAKACFLKSFTYLGQVQQQVFMNISWVLESTCSPPLHDWRALWPVLQSLKQLSTNHRNLDHHPFEIILFFISDIFYRWSVSWYFLWFLVYTWSFTEINFPADISWLFVLSHSNFTMIQPFCCSASVEVTWYIVT